VSNTPLAAGRLLRQRSPPKKLLHEHIRVISPFAPFALEVLRACFLPKKCAQRCGVTPKKLLSEQIRVISPFALFVLEVLRACFLPKKCAQRCGVTRNDRWGVIPDGSSFYHSRIRAPFVDGLLVGRRRSPDPDQAMTEGLKFPTRISPIGEWREYASTDHFDLSTALKNQSNVRTVGVVVELIRINPKAEGKLCNATGKIKRSKE